MVLLKLIPMFLVVAVVVGIITSPYWGRRLRSFREITQRASELGIENTHCNAGENCVFGTGAATLKELSTREKIGAKISLVYCIGQRMNDCFGEWSTEAVRKLFPRVVTGVVVCLILYVVAAVLAPYFQVLEIVIANVDTWTTIFAALSAIFSLTEIYTSIELFGRYKELVSTGKELLSEVG